MPRGNSRVISRMSVEERLTRYTLVDERTGCHLWTGPTVNGYGSVRMKGKNFGAHRLSWELHNGPIPADECICHRCDQPLCINPKHLFLGSLGDNNRDTASKMRSNFGELNPQAKLTDQQVITARAKVAEGAAITEIAKELGIHYQHAYRLVHRLRWKHI